MTIQSTDYVSINRSGTPTDGSSGTYHVDTVQNLTHRVLQRIDIDGRFQLNTNNRWNGFNANTTWNSGTFNNNGGTNAEPNLDWRDYGPKLKDGYIIKNISILGRNNDAEVTDVNLRVYHQTGPAVGLWNNNGSTTRNTILTQNNVGFTGTDHKEINFNNIDFTIAGFGYLLMYIQPLGTLTANRFLQCAITVEYELAA